MNSSHITSQSMHDEPNRFPIKSILALAVSSIIATPAGANPTGASIANGSVSMSGSGRELNITNSPGAIINWDSFSISRDEITRFIQQHDASAVLNRVSGGMPSEILGSLLSNGRVFLINQNGIVFGDHAIVDTAGLVASSLNMTDADFLAGNLRFADGEGTVENRGYIRVRGGGNIMLIAPNVTNSGIIRADDGSVLLAAGRDIVIESLDFEHIRFRIQAPEDTVLNLGRIITTNGIAALFAGTLSHQGVIQARSVSRDAAGRVHLEASSSVSVSGEIDVSGHQIGGDVAITGRDVVLEAARIDASGDQGGGRVRIGGDYQGKGDLARSDRTRLDAATRINADARVAGDGGEVIVWSDGDTDTRALLTARGGATGGDGGLVETSGKGTLAFGQPADVSAPAGAGGTWLLDPEDITIGDAEAESISTALNTGSNVAVKTSDDGDGEGNIAVNSAIAKTEGEDAALSMDAHNRIDVNAPITSTSGKLDVSLKAGGAVHVNAGIDTNGGNFSQVITQLALEINEDNQPSDETDSSDVGDLPDSSQAQDPAVETVVDTSVQVDSDTTESDAVPVDEIVEAVDPVVPEVTEPTQEVLAAGLDAFKQDLEILVDAEIKTGGGDITVDAGSSGTAGVFENLDASNENGVGGTVHILGENVGVFEDARVDASGRDGGGEILIGGDQTGSNPDIPNSRGVIIAPNAEIVSDATGNGDGGKVIVYADHTASILGRISARGGIEGGNGGFVETSGKVNLNVTQAPDISAPQGQGGTWLIDPYDLTINNGGPSANYDYTEAYGGNYTFIGNATGAVLDVATLYKGLAYGGTVILYANGVPGGEDGDINWEADLDFFYVYNSYGQANTPNLYLYADNDINFSGAINRYGGTTAGITNLKFIADDDLNGSGGINILGGAVGEDTRIQIDGDFIARGAFFDMDGGAYESQDTSIVAGGDVDIQVSGAVSITGGSEKYTGALIESRGDMTITGASVSVLGGSGESADASLRMNSDNAVATQTITATAGDIHVEGGSYTGGYGGRAEISAQHSGSATMEKLYQTLIASNNVTVKGGSGYNAQASVRLNSYNENQVATQSVTATGGALTVDGGTGYGYSGYGYGSYSTAEIYAYHQAFAYFGSANLSFNQSLTGASVNILGGSDNYASARVWMYSTDNFANSRVTTGTQSVTATAGDITVQGGSASNTYAEVYADQLDGTIASSLNQTLLASSNVNVTGGSGDDASATVSIGRSNDSVSVDQVTQSVTATGGAITIEGGSGYDSYAEVSVNHGGYGNPSTNQTLSATAINVLGGSERSASARVVMDSNSYTATQSITATSGDITVTGGSYDSGSPYNGSYAEIFASHKYGSSTGSTFYQTLGASANIVVTGGVGDHGWASVAMQGSGGGTTTQGVTATAGNITVEGGSGYAAFGQIFAESKYASNYAENALNQTLSARGVNVIGGSNTYASAGVRMTADDSSRGYYGPSYATQSVTATAGNIRIEGGSAAHANADIGANQRRSGYAYAYGYGTYTYNTYLAQTLDASGDIVLQAGSSADASARVNLNQYVTMRHTDSPGYDSTFIVNANATQMLNASGNINVLGSNTAAVGAQVEFTQTIERDGFTNNAGTEWQSNFLGGQYVQAGGNVNVTSGTNSGGYAGIDPQVTLETIYPDSAPFLPQQSVTVGTKQEIRAGYDTAVPGAINVTANGGNAFITTGSTYRSVLNKYGTNYLTTGYGNDQLIEADTLNVLSETASGAIAEIVLNDGAYYNSTFYTPTAYQDIDVFGSAAVRSANGGIARILNYGLTGSIDIAGNLALHEADETSQTVIQLSNQDEPGSTGALNVLGAVDFLGSPQIISNDTVTFTSITGSGTVGASDIAISGELAPGNSPGVLFFPGNLTLLPGSNSTFEIGGTPVSGLFDRVNVAGTATLDGNMVVVLINGYTPDGMLQYDLISANNLTGGFTTFSGPGFGEGQAPPTTYFVTSTGVPPTQPPGSTPTIPDGFLPGIPTIPAISNGPQPTTPGIPVIPGANPVIPEDTFSTPLISEILTLLDIPFTETPEDRLEEKLKTIGLCTASN
ncbi:MAG: hypothetical protein DHS20C01_18160 [marine bacterium B5-7]|nr:MAG: hypothetical protein DHS20C01_18160 [marine bacterium B5-7]